MNDITNNPDPIAILFSRQHQKEAEIQERISNAERHRPIPYAHKQAIRYRFDCSPFPRTDATF